MFLRIFPVIFGAILTTQCHLVSAQESQESITINQQTLAGFRQLSIRVLSAYKVQPHYIGSTEKWHLFLKKESRQAVDKAFSSIFGYKIPAEGSSIENGWSLNMGVDINPDNCPEVTQYKKDKTGFTLPALPSVKTQCLSR
ncbi:hypothetical protein [Amphritea japonica]|nr:hypothetical protein [Amphritea japonica]